MIAPVQIVREEQKQVLLVSWMFSENSLEKTSENAMWVTLNGHITLSDFKQVIAYETFHFSLHLVINLSLSL